ncbi:DUF6744 family protein [Nocardia aurea]|uniref:DUF6744 family protein n=1 Tax=Nocardia aurea TaxID=2144174 RepID=UPI000D698D0F|nr:DUF6744 family protein [Nocardia aurea]
MTTLAPDSPATETAARELLSTYADKTGEGPVLGYVIVYSVYGGEITLDEATRQFQQLRLDTTILPGPLRADDAFLRVTGSDGVRDTYNLDHLDTDTASGPSTQTPGGPVRSARLMIRPVRRGSDRIVRHIVREERDEKATTLSYDEHLGDVTFERSTGEHGSGQLVIRLDDPAVAALSDAEKRRVYALVDTVQQRYRWQCTYLGADRIRSMLLDYMRRLEAVPVRPTGGVYFVTADHAHTLEGLHRFVAGVGGQSMFARIPLPDQAEMRQLIIRAFIDASRDALQKLSLDIATARRNGASANKTKALLDRFLSLKAQTASYSRRLQNSLDETSSSFDLVHTQLDALLKSQ